MTSLGFMWNCYIWPLIFLLLADVAKTGDFIITLKSFTRSSAFLSPLLRRLETWKLTIWSHLTTPWHKTLFNETKLVRLLNCLLHKVCNQHQNINICSTTEIFRNETKSRCQISVKYWFTVWVASNYQITIVNNGWSPSLSLLWISATLCACRCR